MNEQIEKAAIEYFTEYFAQNYYGTVVFSDPRWHAPRIFRAAKWAIQQATIDAEDSTLETPAVPVGHFWRGEINPLYCKSCGGHYDRHLHTDESSTCPTYKSPAPDASAPAVPPAVDFTKVSR